MQTIDESIEYVNQQLAFYLSRIDDPKTKNLKFFQHHFAATESIKSHLELLKSNVASNHPVLKNHHDYISITPGDIEGLPKELIEELGLTESDHTEFEIVNIIKQHGGVMSLDHLLITLYKKTKVIHKRKILTAKLYRMVNKGLLYNVPDRRGVYSVRKIDSDINDIGKNGVIEEESELGMTNED